MWLRGAKLGIRQRTVWRSSLPRVWEVVLTMTERAELLDYVATGRRGPALSEEDWFAAYWRRRLLFLLLENRGLATIGWWRPRPDEVTHGA